MQLLVGYTVNSNNTMLPSDRMWMNEMSPFKSKHFGPTQEIRQKENSLGNSLIKGGENIPGNTFLNFKTKKERYSFRKHSQEMHQHFTAYIWNPEWGHHGMGEQDVEKV